MAENPDVQKMAQEEISAQVGDDRKVTLADRKLLPYTQGLVMELIRLSDIHPIGVLHAPDKDTTIEGFTVPKGTFIFPNFHKVHRDPAHWGKTPEAIQPQHWPIAHVKKSADTCIKTEKGEREGERVQESTRISLGLGPVGSVHNTCCLREQQWRG